MLQTDFEKYIETNILQFQNFNTALDVVRFHEHLLKMSQDYDVTLEPEYNYFINGYVLFKKGKLEESLEAHFKALSILKTKNKVSFQALLEKGIASLFKELEQFNIALVYLHKSESKKEAISELLLSIIYTEFGNCHIFMNNLETALQYYDQAYELAQNISHVPLINLIKANKGYTLARLTDITEGMSLITDALEYYKKQNLSRITASIYDILGELYELKNLTHDALLCFEKAQWIFYREKSMSYYINCKINIFHIELKRLQPSAKLTKEFEQAIKITLDYKLRKKTIILRKLYIEYLIKKKDFLKLDSQFQLLKRDEKNYSVFKKIEEEKFFLSYIKLMDTNISTIF